MSILQSTGEKGRGVLQKVQMELLEQKVSESPLEVLLSWQVHQQAQLSFFFEGLLEEQKNLFLEVVEKLLEYLMCSSTSAILQTAPENSSGVKTAKNGERKMLHYKTNTQKKSCPFPSPKQKALHGLSRNEDRNRKLKKERTLIVFVRRARWLLRFCCMCASICCLGIFSEHPQGPY